MGISQSLALEVHSLVTPRSLAGVREACGLSLHTVRTSCWLLALPQEAKGQEFTLQTGKMLDEGSGQEPDSGPPTVSWLAGGEEGPCLCHPRRAPPGVV